MKRSEKAVQTPLPPPDPGVQGLTCVVCRSPFIREPNNVAKAKVCTPFAFVHKVRYEPQPDGSAKKIPCRCCRCLYKKTLAKNRSLDGKLIPRARVEEFLNLTKKIHPEVLLAFRVGLNAMLRVTEIAGLEVGDVQPEAQPVPKLLVKALKKTVHMKIGVDINPETAAALKKHTGRRTAGLIFDMSTRTLQRKFKDVVEKMGLGHLSIHALRHTGISNRAKTCKTMDELGYLSVQARHESIETTKIYMGFEDDQRVEMMGRNKWY
jgi:integrase